MKDGTNWSDSYLMESWHLSQPGDGFRVLCTTSPPPAAGTFGWELNLCHKMWHRLTLGEVQLAEHAAAPRRSQAAGADGSRYSWRPQLNEACQSSSFPPLSSSSPPSRWRWWSSSRPPPAPPASGWGRGQGSSSPAPPERDQLLPGTFHPHGLWDRAWRWWRGPSSPSPALVTTPAGWQRLCRDSCKLKLYTHRWEIYMSICALQTEDAIFRFFLINVSNILVLVPVITQNRVQSYHNQSWQKVIQESYHQYPKGCCQHNEKSYH